MTLTKLLIGQILIVLEIILLGVWTATHWAAAMLASEPELRTAGFLLGHLPVYRPGPLFPWWFHYDADEHHVFAKAGALDGESGLLGCAAAVGGSFGAHANRASSSSAPESIS